VEKLSSASGLMLAITIANVCGAKGTVFGLEELLITDEIELLDEEEEHDSTNWILLGKFLANG